MLTILLRVVLVRVFLLGTGKFKAILSRLQSLVEKKNGLVFAILPGTAVRKAHTVRKLRFAEADVEVT